MGFFKNNGFNQQFESMPSYWQSHLTAKINTIKQLQDEDGINRFSIGFITDMHLEGNNDKKSGILMNEIEDQIHLPLILNGGDCISHYRGAITKTNALGQIREMFNMFSPRVRDKMLYMVANHDDNSHSNQVWNETLKEGELYSQFYRHLDNKVIRGETPRYYYVDNKFHKTRFIVLDCNDVPYAELNGRAQYPISNYHAFRQTQLEWFADVALNVPNDGWSVLVTCHAPPYSSGVRGFDRPIRNADLALGILASFRNKTTFTGTSLSTVSADFQATVSSDFTEKGGEVICWLTGDTHRDNVVTMTEYADIKLVTTINDHKNRPSGEPSGTTGTITEQAFDILTIDKTNKNIYLTRIGAGTDRQFSYNRSGGEGEVIFHDSFNRDNASTLGNDWINVRSPFLIKDNWARPVLADGTTSFSLVNMDIPQNNISVEAEIIPNDGEGIVVRYQDEDNYIRVMMEYSYLAIVLVENDVKTNIAIKDYIPDITVGYVLKVELRGTEIKVYIDDVLHLTSHSDKYLTTTKCGIRAWSNGGNNGMFNNFAVKSFY